MSKENILDHELTRSLLSKPGPVSPLCNPDSRDALLTQCSCHQRFKPLLTCSVSTANCSVSSSAPASPFIIRKNNKYTMLLTCSAPPRNAQLLPQRSPVCPS